MTGQFFKQFALTIAFSTVISAFNSLTLSPALAALLLKGHGAKKDRFQRLIDFLFGWFFRPFNWVFRRGSSAYGSGLTRVLQRKTILLGFYALLIGLALFLFHIVPAGFVPAQDKQYLVSFRAAARGGDARPHGRGDPGNERDRPGESERGIGRRFPRPFHQRLHQQLERGDRLRDLKPFDQRTRADQSGFAIAHQLQQKFADIPSAFIAIFPPPPVQGLGTIGGFKLQLEDRAALGNDAMNDALTAFMGKAMQTPELAAMFSSFQINVPQLYADVDRTRAQQLGVSIPMSSTRSRSISVRFT